MVEHLYVKFGDPSSSDFWYRAERQTHATEIPIPVTIVGIGDK